MQNYKNIGELLTRAREEHRWSIAEVAAVLHIRPRYLQALEDGDISLIPGTAYAKGYLTRYASYLSLDRVEVLRRFDVAAEATEGVRFFMPHSFSHDKRIDLVTAMKFTALALLLLLLWALWIRPEQGSVPIVDIVPEKVMEPEPVKLSAEIVGRVACLQPQNTLYPPCYWPKATPEPSVMTIIQP